MVQNHFDHSDTVTWYWSRGGTGSGWTEVNSHHLRDEDHRNLFQCPETEENRESDPGTEEGTSQSCGHKKERGSKSTVFDTSSVHTGPQNPEGKRRVRGEHTTSKQVIHTLNSHDSGEMRMESSDCLYGGSWLLGDYLIPTVGISSTRER